MKYLNIWRTTTTVVDLDRTPSELNDRGGGLLQECPRIWEGTFQTRPPAARSNYIAVNSGLTIFHIPSEWVPPGDSSTGRQQTQFQQGAVSLFSGREKSGIGVFWYLFDILIFLLQPSPWPLALWGWPLFWHGAVKLLLLRIYINYLCMYGAQGCWCMHMVGQWTWDLRRRFDEALPYQTILAVGETHHIHDTFLDARYNNWWSDGLLFERPPYSSRAVVVVVVVVVLILNSSSIYRSIIIVSYQLLGSTYLWSYFTPSGVHNTQQ